MAACGLILIRVDLPMVLVTGLSLAAAAGLNAYIPLLVVGLLARFDIVPLEAPYNLLASTPVLIIVAVLLAIEVFADKIPAVDSVNDVVQTFIRPVAGGLLFAASVNIGGDWVKIAAIVLGVVTAGGVHAAKATARPVINVGTAGVGAPVASTAEDLLSTGLSVTAVLAPIVALVLLVLLLVLIVRALTSRRRRRASVET